MSYCPECGKQISLTAKFCRECGCNLKVDDTEQVQPHESTITQKCVRHPQLDAIGVCTECGLAVCVICKSGVKDKIYCPSCIGSDAVRAVSKGIRGQDAGTPFQKTKNIYITICQSCGIQAQTKYVAFYKVIGMVILRQENVLKANLCKECADSYFWDYTSTTMTLGLFSPISLVLSPFYLLNNLFYYLRTLKMEPPDEQERRLKIEADHPEILIEKEQVENRRIGAATEAFEEGNRLCSEGRLAEAVNKYFVSLLLRPNDPVTLNNLGLAFFELEKYVEALNNFNLSLKFRPDDAGVLYNRGLTLFKLERYKEALNDYNRCLELEPDNPAVLKNRDIVLKRLKELPNDSKS